MRKTKPIVFFRKENINTRQLKTGVSDADLIAIREKILQDILLSKNKGDFTTFLEIIEK
ncbi:hypothetical protein V8J88_14215 [Massilia sp. W12]|uniref:hypothetical protein n=1 Tax=Massilia sp. W12 TaxID=3126507 RepID=UPI0030CA83E8